MLLSGNKDFLVFYRGKNVLSPQVAEALLEKERLAKALQDEEEQARLRASTFYKPVAEPTDDSGTAGTLGETLDANARWGKILNDKDKKKVMKEAEVHLAPHRLHHIHHIQQEAKGLFPAIIVYLDFEAFQDVAEFHQIVAVCGIRLDKFPVSARSSLK
ncbi:hypothetical protein POM88_026803 [Heracleum sosnowskyi]|uniref:Uncharacterized protein n=1 Tax=Heracleum sosnowskyi TaxID=360622 RepID=A0AAD8MPK2_9APIA|nr:hypothetical protein POM88_026803 [Heracleum sosnowskyi]